MDNDILAFYGFIAVMAILATVGLSISSHYDAETAKEAMEQGYCSTRTGGHTVWNKCPVYRNE